MALVVMEVRTTDDWTTTKLTAAERARTQVRNHGRVAESLRDGRPKFRPVICGRSHLDEHRELGTRDQRHNWS